MRSRMPWRCPACGTWVRHSDLEAKPRAGDRYRCHTCRLELTLNPNTGRLTMTPMGQAADEPSRKPRKEQR